MQRPADQRRVVENVTRKRLAARPGEGPEGRRQTDRVEFGFGLVPDFGRFIGAVEADFRNEGETAQAGLTADEFDRAQAHRAPLRQACSH